MLNESIEWDRADAILIIVFPEILGIVTRFGVRDVRCGRDSYWSTVLRIDILPCGV